MNAWIRLILLIAAFGGGACSEDSTDETDGDSERGDTDSDTETENDFVPDPEGDVCNFSEPVPLGDPADDGMVLVPPNHPEIQYFGRVDCSDPAAPAFGFPGVTIRMRFEGDEVGFVLDDSGTATYPNFYNVVIDDQEPIVVKMEPGENTITAATDLEDTEHTVEIFKRVESNSGKGRGAFLGFRIPEGSEPLHLAPKPYRLEVVGDSISCGYGNEISVDDPTGYTYTTENSNAYNAWGAIAARDLDAEYLATAYSGRGIYRNYSGGGGETLPEMYLKSIPDGSSAIWDVHQFTPDVLVINLGTNDFSPGLDVDTMDDAQAEFELTYLEFVETLRSYYPQAVFILAVGPMLSDGYPSGYRALTRVRESLEAIVAARAADGDGDVHFLELPQQSAPYGEDWHPTVATHMSMAGDLADLIDSLDLMQ